MFVGEGEREKSRIQKTHTHTHTHTKASLASCVSPERVLINGYFDFTSIGAGSNRSMSIMSGAVGEKEVMRDTQTHIHTDILSIFDVISMKYE